MRRLAVARAGLLSALVSLQAIPVHAQLAPPEPGGCYDDIPGRYIVWFEPGSGELSDCAWQMIADAAQHYHEVGGTRVELNGIDDPSGTPAQNWRKAVRRAQLVIAMLVRDGVPRTDISIDAFGETGHLPPYPGQPTPRVIPVKVVVR